jgi:hypothetical protein
MTRRSVGSNPPPATNFPAPIDRGVTRCGQLLGAGAQRPLLFRADAISLRADLSVLPWSALAQRSAAHECFSAKHQLSPPPGSPSRQWSDDSHGAAVLDRGDADCSSLLRSRRPALANCRRFWGCRCIGRGSLMEDADRSDRNDERDNGEEENHIAQRGARWSRTRFLRCHGPTLSHGPTLTLSTRLGRRIERCRQSQTRQRQSKNKYEGDGKAENRTPTSTRTMVVS